MYFPCLFIVISRGGESWRLFFLKGGPYHRFDPLDEKCIEKVCLSLSFHGERNWRNVALSIKRSLFHSIDRCVCTADVFDGSLALPAAPFFIEISYGRWYLRTETARIAVNELSCCFSVSRQSGWTSRTDRNRWRSSGGRRGSLKWPNPIWISSVSLFVSNYRKCCGHPFISFRLLLYWWFPFLFRATCSTGQRRKCRRSRPSALPATCSLWVWWWRPSSIGAGHSSRPITATPITRSKWKW